MELQYTPVHGYVEGRQLYYKIKNSKRRNGALTCCRHGDSGAASRERVLAVHAELATAQHPTPRHVPGRHENRSTQRLVHEGAQQRYSQWPPNGNNPDVHQLRNEETTMCSVLNNFQSSKGIWHQRATTRMHLGIITLIERSQTQRPHCDSVYVKCPRIGKVTEKEVDEQLPGAGGGGMG